MGQKEKFDCYTYALRVHAFKLECNLAVMREEIAESQVQLENYFSVNTDIGNGQSTPLNIYLKR